MKKTISVFTILMLSLLFTACSKQTTEAVNTTDSTTQNQSTTIAPTTASPTTLEVGYTIDNLVLVDNEDLTITLTEAYDDDFWGFTLNVFIENKTLDKELMFSVTTAIVNGYDFDPFWASSLQAGKKSNSEINFYESTQEELGIVSFDKIELYIRVYDYDDWEAEDLVDQKFTIYPTGLTEQEITSPARPTNANEVIIIDNEYFTFIIIETYVDPIWGYTLVCFLENKRTDIEIMFSWDDVSVNDYAIDPYWAKSLMPSSKAISEVSFYQEDFDENDIQSVAQIEFTLRIYDYTYFLDDDLYNSPYTYYPAE